MIGKNNEQGDKHSHQCFSSQFISKVRAFVGRMILLSILILLYYHRIIRHIPCRASLFSPFVCLWKMPLFGLKRKRSNIELRGRSRPRGRSLERKRSFILRKRASTLSNPSVARSRAERDSHLSRSSTARSRARSDFQPSKVAKLKRKGSLLLVKLHLRKRMGLTIVEATKAD
jgi:hypothetical protein